MNSTRIVSSIEFGQRAWKFYMEKKHTPISKSDALQTVAIARHTYDNLLIRKVVESDFIRPEKPRFSVGNMCDDYKDTCSCHINLRKCEALRQWESWVPLFILNNDDPNLKVYYPKRVKRGLKVMDMRPDMYDFNPSHPTLQSINYSEIITI